MKLHVSENCDMKNKPSLKVILSFFWVIHAFNRGVARNFQRGGGVTLRQSEGSHQIVMSFLPPVVGCLLKKSLQKGSHGYSWSPPPPGLPPGLAYLVCISSAASKATTFLFCIFVRWLIIFHSCVYEKISRGWGWGGEGCFRPNHLTV